MNKVLHTAIAAALWATGAGGASMSAMAAPQAGPASANSAAADRDYTIAAGDLDQALRQYAVQSGIQLIYSSASVRGQTSPGLRGRHSHENALRQLLVASGLQIERINATTIALRPGDATAPLKPAKETTSRPQNRPARKADDEVVGMPAIMVQGARTLNMDVVRSIDDPQPYVIFNREMLERSGATNLEDFLKNQLVMNTVSQTNMQDTSTPLYAGQTKINLRGLGTNQTLILVDGRRPAGGFVTFGNPAQPNINGIPLASIERIEVLPTTASGIYGGSATGGVVNIIMRRDYSGFEARYTFDNTVDGGGLRRRADISGGFNLEDGRTTLMISASWSQDADLRVGDRDFFYEGRQRVYENNPASLYGATPPLGGTTNFRSVSGADLVLLNGTSLGSAYAHVPYGYAGVASDGGLGLRQGAGRYNLDLSPSVQATGGAASLLAGRESKNLTATVRREFSERLQMFADFSASNNRITSFTGLGSGVAVLPAGAPGNPFQQEVRVNFPVVPEHVPPSEGWTGERRATVGAIFKLTENWLAEADYNWGRQTFGYATNILLDPNPPTPAYRAAALDGTLDVFRDINAYPFDYSAYPMGTSTFSFGDAVSVANSVSMRLTGPFGSLPAGRPVLSAMVEYRDQEFEQAAVTSTLSFPISQYPSGIIFPSRSQAVASAYLEARIPLVSSLNALPGIKALDLQFAGRYDRYKTDGVTGSILQPDQPVVRLRNNTSSRNPTLALRYQPLDALTLRGSYGTGFLPPDVNQLIPNAISTTTGFVDPKRGNTALQAVPYLNGGNPDLGPETSKSWSAGLIFHPGWLRGLRVSADWTKIEKDDAIATLTHQVLLDNEALFPDRIQRGPKLPGDPAEWAGPVIYMDQTLANISQLELEVYDVRVDYNFETASMGSFDLYALATWQTHHQTRLLPGAPLQDLVGVTSSNPLKFRANFGVTWRMGNLDLNWYGRFFDSYLVANPTASSAAGVFLNQGARSVPSQVYHDLSATYRFFLSGAALERSWGKWVDGLEIQGGVRNVFGAKPPFDASSNLYYSWYADPRMTSYYLSFKKSF